MVLGTSQTAECGDDRWPRCPEVKDEHIGLGDGRHGTVSLTDGGMCWSWNGARTSQVRMNHTVFIFFY